MSAFEVVDIAIRISPGGHPNGEDIQMAIMLLVKAQRAISEYEAQFSASSGTIERS